MIIVLAIFSVLLVPGNLVFANLLVMMVKGERGLVWKDHRLWLVMWLGWALVGVLMSGHSEMAFYGYGLRMEGWVSWAIIMRLAWLTWEGNGEGFLWMGLVGLALSWGLGWMVGEEARMTRVSMAAFSAMLGCVLWNSRRWLAIMMIPCLLWAQSRAAIVGLVAGIIVSEIFRRDWKPNKKIFWIIPAILVIALSPLGRKFRDLNYEGIGKGSRIAWLIQGCDLIKEKPIQGFGLDTLKFHLKPANGMMTQQGAVIDRTHNVIMDMTLQTGIVGLFMLCVVGVRCVDKVWDHPTNLNLACVSALTCWLVIGFFNPQGIPAHLLMCQMVFGIRGKEE